MSKSKGLSRKAALAKGALAVYLHPKLAQDASITKAELKPVAELLATVTGKNWLAKKSALVAAVAKCTAGKLAADANLDDMPGMLDRLDDQDAGPDDNMGGDQPDGGPMSKMLAFLTGKLSDEDLAQVQALCATGDEAETDEEKKAREEAERKAKLTGDDPPPTPGSAGLPARPATSNQEPKVDKPTMDAAIAKARGEAEESTIKRMQAIHAAENEVRPYIGEIAIAQDSAEAVYKLALDHAKIDLTEVHPSAFRSMVRALLPKLAADAKKLTTVPIALDAAGRDAFKSMFPSAVAPRQLG